MDGICQLTIQMKNQMENIEQLKTIVEHHGREIEELKRRDQSVETRHDKIHHQMEKCQVDLMSDR